jgi:hypothetical protein
LRIFASANKCPLNFDGRKNICIRTICILFSQAMAVGWTSLNDWTNNFSGFEWPLIVFEVFAVLALAVIFYLALLSLCVFAKPFSCETSSKNVSGKFKSSKSFVVRSSAPQAARNIVLSLVLITCIGKYHYYAGLFFNINAVFTVYIIGTFFFGVVTFSILVQLKVFCGVSLQIFVILFWYANIFLFRN